VCFCLSFFDFNPACVLPILTNKPFIRLFIFLLSISNVCLITVRLSFKCGLPSNKLWPLTFWSQNCTASYAYHWKHFYHELFREFGSVTDRQTDDVMQSVGLNGDSYGEVHHNWQSAACGGFRSASGRPPPPCGMFWNLIQINNISKQINSRKRRKGETCSCEFQYFQLKFSG